MVARQITDATGGEVGAAPTRPEGMGWRVGVSILTFFGALIAVIMWLFFYAGGFNVYQNVAVIVVIFLVFIAIMGATWASWGMRQSDWWERRSQQGVAMAFLSLSLRDSTSRWATLLSARSLPSFNSSRWAVVCRV